MSLQVAQEQRSGQTYPLWPAGFSTLKTVQMLHRSLRLSPKRLSFVVSKEPDSSSQVHVLAGFTQSASKMPEKKNSNKKYSKRPSLRPEEGMADFVFGKVPPQSIPLEEAVLGALMLERDAMAVVVDILHPETFYLETHQAIFQAMRKLFNETRPIDLLTVTEALKSSGELEAVGGPAYLTKLTMKVTSSANLEYHARLLSQKFIQRELIRVSTKIIQHAYEDTTDIFELMDEAERELFSITEQNLRRSVRDMKTILSQALRDIEMLKDKEDGLTGVPTGFADLDRRTSGWQASDLVILAARPAMGKTAFALTLARNAAIDYGKPVALFSLEMSDVQLIQRLISMEANISSEKLRSGKLSDEEWNQLEQAMSQMGDVPIYIDDTPGLNIFELRAKCRRLKSQYDIQLVIIDYLQLMGSSPEAQRGNREQEVSAISRSLKGMAKELNIPVIALSQLSRAVEIRGGAKRPQLSDLRESGSIEQDADMVMFLYRAEYYKIEEDEEQRPTKGVAELILAKNRHGSADTIRLKWISEYTRFEELDDTNFDDFPSQIFMPTDDSANVIIKPSKMNDDEDIPF